MIADTLQISFADQHPFPFSTSHSLFRLTVAPTTAIYLQPFSLHMHLYPGATFADRIKLLTIWLVILITGDTNHRKEILWEEYELAFMQELPISRATFERVQDFDVVFQQANNYHQERCNPGKYMIGMCKPAGSRFERIHLLSKVNPFSEYKLVKSVSDLYQSDTTYLDVLLRNRKNELESIIYRKVKPHRKTDLDTEFMMWKKEKILIKKDTIQLKLIEKWNSHLFD